MCVVAIDFDDTITADLNAAREAIEKLKAAGHTIVIWSSRNSTLQHGNESWDLMQEMVDILDENGIDYDHVDTGNAGKFHAQVYIDDKAIRFENNWDEIVSRIY